MTDEVKLSEEEIRECATYRFQSDVERSNLGSLRLQYLQEERKIIEALSRAENEMLTYIKSLAESKGVPSDESWVFDFSKYCFVKKTEE